MNRNKELFKKELIDFLKKEYKKLGMIPSGRKIYDRFKIFVWSDFKGGLKEVYKLCGFKFSPQENKRKLRKKFYLQKRNKKRKEIIKYFLQKLKVGKYPTTGELRKKFFISLLTYFPGGIRELYKITKASPPASLRDREELQKEIIEYIQSQVKNDFYPTYYEIEEKFHTNIESPIQELYKLAEIQYKRDPNPFLRYKKEKKLVGMVLKLFSKMDYKIKKISIGPSGPSGADIIIEDNQQRLIPIEIKAFQKFGKIGQTKNSPYIRNEFLQLKRYIKNLSAPYGYLVTSTDRKTFKSLPSNIKVLFGKDLRKLLLQSKMHKEIRDLEWIRNSSISYGKEKVYKKIREKILKYVDKRITQGKYVPNDEIMNKFKVNIESYFSGGMREIYKKFNIDVESIPNYRMSRKFDKGKFKKEIIIFVKEVNKKGRFPTYKEIQRKFRCLPKLYFPRGIREIAKLVGIRYNRKFATKTPEEKELIRNKIINYIKKERQKGYSPRWREIEQKFKINILNYFKNMNEIYGPIEKAIKKSDLNRREKDKALHRLVAKSR